MKENLIKLRRIERKIDIDKFYSITIGPSEIYMQGIFKEEILNFLKLYKFQKGYPTSGYLRFTRSNITVTLTR